MPDIGDFDERGAPASPASWGDAFAALPRETPDAGGWQRLQARLPAANTPPVHRRWRLACSRPPKLNCTDRHALVRFGRAYC